MITQEEHDRLLVAMRNISEQAKAASSVAIRVERSFTEQEHNGFLIATSPKDMTITIKMVF